MVSDRFYTLDYDEPLLTSTIILTASESDGIAVLSHLLILHILAFCQRSK